MAGVISMARKQKKREPLTPEKVILDRRRQLADIADIKSFISRLIVLVLLFFILFRWVFGIKPMQNEDMSPRISAGDLMLFYRMENELHINDVVIFEKDGKTYTGRVIAQGGDVVEVTDEAQLIINGSAVIESGIYYKTPKYDADVTYPLTIQKSEYFILCDYREGAKDSRYFGPVSEDEIEGKVITVIRRSGL